MSLDISLLCKARQQAGKTIAQCPACAEEGGDDSGEHLIIHEDGKFGCVVNQGPDGKAHRARIFELVGVKTQPREKSIWKALAHAPTGAPDPALSHYKHGQPTAHWIYRTEDGHIAGLVARFDLPGGKKETLPLSWCRDQHGEARWQWKAFAEPRPLYGLPFSDGPVVIVEGEKCADAVAGAGFQSTTWQGGCAAAHKTDFGPLQNRDVIVWPDNDQPGFRAMAGVMQTLRRLGARIKIVEIPEGKPEGWDAADEPAMIKEILATAGEPPEEPVEEVFAPPADDAPTNRIGNLPFRLLGMDDGIMRYMPDNGQHIVSLAPASHKKLSLLQLAPLQSWEQAFPAKSGADWDAVSNALIQLSQAMPRFDPRCVRGRGCWIDGSSVIYHAGDKLSVDGEVAPITRHRSRYIYEAGLSIQIDASKAAKNAEAARVIELCEALSWDQPMNGKLLAGWVALAPICGALQWRPHVWITGSAGSGKTWIVSNIVAPLLGSSSIFVQGNTSEAGIRGQIGCDALPVMFDEAEAENIRSASRMEGVLELARQASSESGAAIVKGTQNGGSITYMVRSMFCFSSIGVAAVKKADTSRISVLNLKKSDDKDQFERVKSVWRETVARDEFCAAVRARSIRSALTIRENADAFSSAAVDFTGDKRSADQIGTLLAGAYSLTSLRVIEPDSARAWMEKQDWNGFRTDTLDADENQCLAHLMSSLIRVEHGSGLPEMITVDECLERIDRQVDAESERLALQRVGIKRDSDGLHIANNHQGLERIFKDTAWGGAKWRNQLLRVAGAKPSPKPIRFGQSVVQRCVSLP